MKSDIVGDFISWSCVSGGGFIELKQLDILFTVNTF